MILLALNLAHGSWQQATAHLWPIIAFVVGVAIAVHVKRGRLDRVLPHPIRWTIALQVVVLVVVGFVPASVEPSVVTIPIAFVAALQIELFRSIGDLNYVAVATTGNLMRWVEAGYGRTVVADPASGPAFRTYRFVIGAFAGGAVVGAFATRWLGCPRLGAGGDDRGDARAVRPGSAPGAGGGGLTPGCRADAGSATRTTLGLEPRRQRG